MSQLSSEERDIVIEALDRFSRALVPPIGEREGYKHDAERARRGHLADELADRLWLEGEL